MSVNYFTPAEYGCPAPGPRPVLPDGQPRGDARFPVPHAATFLGLSNAANRAYLYWYDEAMQHGRENADRMRLDPVIDASMDLLVQACSLIPGRIEADDENNQFEAQCARDAQRVLRRTPGLTAANRWLFDDGVFKGRTGLQQRWQWVNRCGRDWHTLTAFEPIDGDKLVYKWADDQVGILVNSLFAGPTVPSERGPVWIAGPEDRECLTVFEYEPQDVSYYRPMNAGAIHGLGIRGKLFWLWALKSHVWALATDYLEWFARGLTLFYFDAGNDEELRGIQKWVNGQLGSHAMFYPRFRAGDPQFKPVERLETSTASSAFLQSLIMNYFDDIIKLKIVGQTLTSGTGSTGLGSGVAAAHLTTFDTKVKYVCTLMDDCRSRDWVTPFYRSNYPGVSPGHWVSDIDDPNVQQMIENAESLFRMGATLPEEPLVDAAGIGAPKDDEPILKQQTGPVKLSRRQAAGLVRRIKSGDQAAVRLFAGRRLVVEE